MGKCIAYTAAAIVFMGLGALITGVALYFVYPEIGGKLGFGGDESRVALCVLQSAPGQSVSGVIKFEQDEDDDDTLITANISGLSPGAHGFHIHEFGGTGNSCKDAGGHFNPFGLNHGGPDDDIRHVGDLGNINSVGEGGNTLAVVRIEDEQVTLFGATSVIGRAVVIHEGRDDLGASGHAAGAAGARVACCTIYAAAALAK